MFKSANSSAVTGLDRAAASVRRVPAAPSGWMTGADLRPQHGERVAGTTVAPATTIRRRRRGAPSIITIKKFEFLSTGSTVRRPPV